MQYTFDLISESQAAIKHLHPVSRQWMPTTWASTSSTIALEQSVVTADEHL